MDSILSRRSAIRVFAFAGFALAAFAGFGPASATDRRQTRTVETDARFHSGPGTDDEVITGIPQGATFALTAQERKGSYAAEFNSTGGWIHAPLIVGAISSGDHSMVGEAYATSAVNLRSGPGTDHAVLRTVASGSTLNVSNTVQNGFRYVVHEGTAGWLSDQFIAWRTGTGIGAGSTFTTTVNLNLRAEPSTSAKILLVMPVGSTVTALDGGMNGFQKVAYRGTAGWASTAYLM
jgi:uncharacterized protein YraI